MADGDWKAKTMALVKALRGTGPTDEVPSWAQPPQSVTDGIRAFSQGLTGDWGNRLTGVPDEVADAASRSSPGAYGAGRILTLGRTGPIGAAGTILASRARLGQTDPQAHGSLDDPTTWSVGVVGPVDTKATVAALRKGAVPAAEEAGLNDFAAMVQRAADQAAPQGGALPWGGGTVFISKIKALLPKEFHAEFDKRLLQASEAGLLKLGRADLVESMDPRDVAASLVRGPADSSFHFIKQSRR